MLALAFALPSPAVVVALAARPRFVDLVLAAQSSHISAFAAGLAFGLVVAVIGHIVRSRTVILTGLLIIALVSAYFSFVYQPPGM